MTNPTTVKLVNTSSNPVRVIGYRGSDLSNVPISTLIGPSNIPTTVASYNFPYQASGDDNYDWIYLLDTVTLTEYQIYLEVNDTPFSGTHKYAYIGYYDPSSSQENGNPLPFPNASSWSANWAEDTLLTYYLTQTPPARQSGPYQSFLIPPASSAGITPIPVPLSAGQSYCWNVANTNTNTDTYADLYLITTAPNAQPSISILDGSAQFARYVMGSPFSAPINDATNYGAWLVGDYNGDGIADLFGIKVNNTGGNIQVCVLDGSNKFQSFLLSLTDTTIPASDAAYFRWALGVYGGGQTPSLWGIQVSNTQTQTVEVHALDGSNQYKTPLFDHGTPIPVADAANYAGWAMIDYNNGYLNLCGIKVANTDTGMVEVDILDGSNDLKYYLLQAYTPISTLLSNVYVGWMMADYLGNGFQDLFGINVGPVTTSGKVEVMIVNGAYQS